MVLRAGFEPATYGPTPSLNDCLYRGPVLLENLCGLLMRFRLNRIAITSDIEKAFLQIQLQRPDRDDVRFLWLKEVSQPVSPRNIVHYRFRRVCFGVVTSPFLLAATISHHLTAIDTPYAKEMAANVYVDNILGGKPDCDSAYDYYIEGKSIFSTASMNLREWHSNSSQLMERIPEKDRGQGAVTKVLGILWDKRSDCLHCQSGKPLIDERPTKRKIVHSIAQIFDPCGYFSPLIVTGKALMQELWQQKYDWDSALSEPLALQWKKFAADYPAMETVAIPRFVGDPTSSEVTSVELHSFCDASAKAYCATVYLVISRSSGNSSHLLFAKSKVKPLKPITIPQLELLAATLSIRSLQFVESNLGVKLSRKVVWSDSKCVLHWIVGKPVTTVFVKNRVKEIRNCVGVYYKYVPTKDNPADMATRGVKAVDLQGCHLWWHGPSWLIDETEWPLTDIADSPVDDNPHLPQANILPVAEPSRPEPPTSGIDPSRCSSFVKLLRIAAWVKRFIVKLRSRNGVFRSFSAEELQAAKHLLLREAQLRHFGDLFAHNAKKSHLARQLKVFVGGDGLLRCSGRIQNSELPDSAIYPILLPQKGDLTSLIIQNHHNTLQHAGVRHTLASLRYEYWVPKCRPLVKRVLSKCLKCRRWNTGPFRVPDPPPLPDFRLRRQRGAFDTVGLDYLGPLLIFNAQEGQQKVWISLFTCAVTRAVHLEVVIALTTEQFLLCFRRFMAQYGVPSLMVCENAKQFKTAQATLRNIWQSILESDDVQSATVIRGIAWKFIVEMAPWMGGFYERLVGVVKNSLKRSLSKRRLNLVELQTVVAEISALINTRPLCYSEEEIGDHPLTPAHLTMRHHSLTPFAVEEKDTDFTSKRTTMADMILGWRRIQKLAVCFWDSWTRSYLTSLREHYHQKHQRASSPCLPRVGGVVLIKDHLPRGQWKTGVIVDLIVSKDGFCRAAKVKIPAGTVLNRPLRLLFPLECQHEEGLTDANPDNAKKGSSWEARCAPKAKSDSESQNDNSFGDGCALEQRPQRLAAAQARDKIKALASDPSSN